MQLNKFLDVKPEVAEAIAAGKPVVALESTIISHGMPYPPMMAMVAGTAPFSRMMRSTSRAVCTFCG